MTFWTCRKLVQMGTSMPTPWGNKWRAWRSRRGSSVTCHGVL